jgi:hypothetical protein
MLDHAAGQVLPSTQHLGMPCNLSARAGFDRQEARLRVQPAVATIAHAVAVWMLLMSMDAAALDT